MIFTIHYYLFIVLPLVSATVCDRTYLKHNDTVYIHKLCLNPRTGEIGRGVCNITNTTRAVFQIRKNPYYKSECDYVLSGNSVTLTSVNTENVCSIDPKDFAVRCSSHRNGTKVIRILNKHGGDKLKLSASGHYVKFRQMHSQIDCNDGPTKLKPGYIFSCKKCPLSKPYYGFVIMRDI